MRPIEPLVSATWLSQRLKEPELRVVDVRLGVVGVFADLTSVEERSRTCALERGA
ncbi:MAG: hypothetical protein ACYCWW_11740 [Deltaproteobacteria bacterium]